MLKIKTFAVGPIEANCYIAYDDGTKEALLIDPGVYDERVSGFIKDKSLAVKYIVNTHGHYDHIEGNKAFGYPVLIHEEDKECLSNPVRNLSIISGYSIPSVEPYRLLKDQDVIQLNGLSFKVIHTPGHSPGGITLECEGVLFSGDTLFCQGVGRTDIPFSSQKALEESLAKLMHYDNNTRVYPGHGPATTIGDEKQANLFL